MENLAARGSVSLVLEPVTQAAVLRRDSILRALAVLAERLLKAGAFEDEIGEVLRILGQAAGVDRTYLFENHTNRVGALVVSQRYEWSKEGISAQICNPDLQDIPYDAPSMRAWKERLSRGDCYHAIVRQLPRDVACVLEKQGVRSIIVVPVFMGDHWWGFLGFDDCQKEHEWSEMECDALKAAAGIVGSAIERGMTERLLRQADKMAALGQIIAGVAHEINNPNNFICFNLPILRRYVEAMRPLLDYHLASNASLELLNMPYSEFMADLDKLIDNMVHGSNRITGIVAELKSYIRSDGEQQAGPGDLAEVIDRVMRLVGKQVRKTVKRLDVQLPETLPEINMNQGKIEQVLINLLINAGQAADKDDSWVLLSVRNTDDHCVEIQVADNGCGIPAEHMHQVFEPFFTSKGRQGGTGLGLSISHRIVEGHGGTLTVQSEVNKGTTFTIRLPAITRSHCHGLQ